MYINTKKKQTKPDAKRANKTNLTDKLRIVELF